MACDAPDCRNDHTSAARRSRQIYLKVQVHLLSGWQYLAGCTMSRTRYARDHGLATSGATEQETNMSLDNASYLPSPTRLVSSRRPGPDELVPSRYAMRVGEIDVQVISDG